MVFFFGFFREEDRVGRIEIIKSEKTQERGSEGRVHPGHETESGVEEDDEEELLVGRRATQSQQREKSERDKDIQAGVGVETQTQRNKEIRRTRDWKRRLHSGAALFLLYWRGGCQKPGEVGFLTNTHTHTLTVSYTPHLNVPRGALVLPLSSIWETVQGPGERERGSAQVCYALRVWRGRKKKKRKKKGWYKSDPDSRQNHGLLSHKHMRLCGIIFRAISCWLTGVYCAQHNTTMLFIQAGKKLHSRDGGKRRWRSKIAESPAPQGLRRTPHYTRYFPRSRWIRVKRRSIDM